MQLKLQSLENELEDVKVLQNKISPGVDRS